MRNGWFGITLENDEHFKVQEADLYNQKLYEIERPRLVTTSEQREKSTIKLNSNQSGLSLKLRISGKLPRKNLDCHG